MYVRQHPTYRRLSSNFLNQRRGEAHKNQYRQQQQEPREEYAVTSHDFTNWERIGRGGFGKVYRVKPRSPALYKDIGSGYLAIKMVDKRALKDSAAEQRLAAEVAIHESIKHPSITRIYDSFEDDRFVYIVMEYCASGDLWRYLRQRYIHIHSDSTSPELAPLSEPEARYIMSQVASAVGYLHSNGILHRDLKLANMMLGYNMEIKVGDFGLATQIYNGVMEPMTLCGTPSYISPEILARKPYSFESDIWALGCLFVTLLTGRQPFHNKGGMITEDQVRGIRLPRDVSNEARQLVGELLRIDPRQRIRSEELPSHPFFTSLMSVSTPVPKLDQLDAWFEDQRQRNQQQQQQQQQHRHPRRILQVSEDIAVIRSKNFLPPRHPDILARGGSDGYEDHGALQPPESGAVSSEEFEMTSRRGFQDYRMGNRRRNDARSRANGEHSNSKYISAGIRPASSHIAAASNSNGNGIQVPYYRPHSADIAYARAGGSPNRKNQYTSYSRQPHSTIEKLRAEPVSLRQVDSNHIKTRESNEQQAAAHNGSPPLPAKTVDLASFTTRRLQPMKRAMKNGKIYMRDDHLVVLDLASSTTLVAMDEYTQNVYEYKRPLHLDSLAPESAHRTYPWDLNQMPERVAKAVRVGCRCILYLLSQQKRIKISTPQGKGWLFEDSPLGTFKFAFFNGIKVDVSRRNAEATVEIPSSQDLPNEIQKIPLLPSDFPHALGTNGDDEDNIGSGDIPLDFSDLSMQRRHHQHSGSSENGRKIPEKIRGILEHAKEALRKVLEFDTVLMEFEEGGSLCQQYEGSIGYPVSLSWDWDGSSDLDYVPPGLARRRQPPPKPTGGSSRNDKDFGALPMSVSNTAGSTTAVASVRSNSRRLQELEDRQKHQHQHHHQHHHQRQQQNIRAADDQRDHQKQKWNVNALDRRTVDDTPTRRLNMGPITRLVEEFNQPVNLQDHIVADRRYQAQQAQQAQLQKFLSTPGSLFRTPAAGHSNRGFSSTQVHLAAQQGFEDACFIPDVGWCLLASTSDDDEDCLFTILFCDGCRVLVKQKMQAIWYKDGAVEYADLPIDHSLPVRVKERIKWLPQFLSAMGFEI